MAMGSDSSGSAKQRIWAATAAQILLGLIAGPVFTYVLVFLSSSVTAVPFKVVLASALMVSFACGVGFAVANRSLRAFGVALASGVILYATFLCYLFSSFFNDRFP